MSFSYSAYEEVQSDSLIVDHCQFYISEFKMVRPGLVMIFLRMLSVKMLVHSVVKNNKLELILIIT